MHTLLLLTSTLKPGCHSILCPVQVSLRRPWVGNSQPCKQTLAICVPQFSAAKQGRYLLLLLHRVLRETLGQEKPISDCSNDLIKQDLWKYLEGKWDVAPFSSRMKEFNARSRILDELWGLPETSIRLCKSANGDDTMECKGFFFLGWERTSVYSKVFHWKVSEGRARSHWPRSEAEHPHSHSLPICQRDGGENRMRKRAKNSGLR